MAREINRLTARQVATLSAPGRYADGGNLYLSISANGGRRWCFLYRRRSDGKPTELGFGAVRDVPLARARKMASEARAHLAEGRDPRAERKPSRSATFGEVADAYVAAHESTWRNEKHAAQWHMTLREYAAPLRTMPIASVSVDDVLQVLQPIWTEKPETASRLRGRIERVLDAAKAKGLRQGENPARWRGHLDHLLGKRQRLTRGHHSALPYDDAPGFLTKLRGRTGIAALALEFAILTAARTGEVVGAKWDEFTLDASPRRVPDDNGGHFMVTGPVWEIPPERMKAKRRHLVPLSTRAVEILTELAAARRSDYVFPGPVARKPLSTMAMATVLRRMKRADITVHGFRSTFRDWAGERTNFPRDVCEAALAHALESKVEAAYRRGTALEKRRTLMETWAVFCAGEAAKVIPLRA